ncbi:DNA polymerase [Clostridium sp. NSJ-49]|uniref:DNA polymerase n=1 Tax=Clostridium TaxID=1485 RepID=UPI00164CCFF5|nr:DNA polymerase [Clostridium sp. NSJ-49]MBC5624414.1 DNA polymerase [Clostridium sp. NSJ-49]
MRILSIDIETYSDVDLIKSGVYPYTASSNFEILLFAYAFDDEEVKIIDLANDEKIPTNILEAIEDKNIIKTAFNANFERVCLGRFLNKSLSSKSWRCTAVHALSLGLPSSLEAVAEMLNLEQQKMKEGKALIKYFSVPCTIRNDKSQYSLEGQIGKLMRNYPKDSLEKWELFKKYCIKDVEVERAIRKKLERFPVIENEHKLYVLDQEINDRGIYIDMELVTKAISCDELYKNKSLNEAKNITGLSNPNSVTQLKKWLYEKGIEIKSLSKVNIKKILEDCDDDVRELLELRLKLSKTSVRKYEAIQRAVSKDFRVRGLFKFYGANRTGRWAGKLVQVHNLPQNHLEDMDSARNLVKEGDFLKLEDKFNNIPQLLSELIRSAFIPKKSARFIIADFSAIEARILAYIADEKWRIDVFKSHGKIYEASASKLFKVPIEMITKESNLRVKGKVAELALGYGGGVGALKAMGALEMGIEEDELQDLVNKWRLSNSNIGRLWWAIHKAAINALKTREVNIVGYIKIYYQGDIMFITLPSGRKLSYVKPRIEKNKYGGDSITYEGVSAAKKWERIETYGPKLVENIVQAIARDILGEAMIRLRDKGYDIVMHVHDEIIIEAKEGQGSLEEVIKIMTETPIWARGLPLDAEGFESKYYKK